MDFTQRELRAAERRIEAQSDPHEQLRIARQQAEGYRNFLSSLTAVLTAVFVLKGQEDLSKLDSVPRWTVVGLLISGFVTLIVASWLGVLATDGRPGEESWSEPGRFLEGEVRRTRRIWRLVEWARWLAVAGVVCVAAAVITTWVAPSS
ncbi:hypothetical protein [Streptomyces sp. NBC_01361]|uniref:hypothetical protein n=1 Tax=Streptomyces sp. NBC_01361 TaxID=2903838 RepID=UPI002E3508FA|nr:hypothetical protein [Streptomyces sp. NBC_01361]